MIDLDIIHENSPVLKQAVQIYGVPAQVEMMIEECSELILALQKLKRALNNDVQGDELMQVHHAVYSEVADVLITVGGQSGIIWDDHEIYQYIEYKLERLKIRLNNGTHKPAKVITPHGLELMRNIKDKPQQSCE